MSLVMTHFSFKLCRKSHKQCRYFDFNDFNFTPGSTNKRKQSFMDGPAAKQPKTIYPAYFIPELAHVVAMCDEKLPFFALAQALNQRKLPHTGLQVEANSTSLVLKLLTLPMPETKPNDSKVPHIPTNPFSIRSFKHRFHAFYQNSQFSEISSNHRFNRLECLNEASLIRVDSITCEEFTILDR